MRIKLGVSGGFAGIQWPAKQVDCDALDESAANRWRELVEQANFFELPKQNLAKHGNDLMQYTITVEDDSKRHQVVVDDLSLSDSLAHLVSKLREI